MWPSKILARPETELLQLSACTGTYLTTWIYEDDFSKLQLITFIGQTLTVFKLRLKLQTNYTTRIESQ